IAEAPDLDRLAHLGLQLATRDEAFEHHASIAEISRVPELERLAYAGHDIWLHLGGEPMSGDIDLADEPGVGHRAAGADDPDRSRRNDPLQIGMAFDEALRLSIALVRGIVAINHADQRHLGVIELLQLLLHFLDP